jgi:serine/threonine protein phosphatase 1
MIRLPGFGRARAEAPLPQLEAPVAVVGDLHGRADLLEGMLARLALLPEARDLRVIFLGDAVDRGPDSAGVLHRLAALQAAPAPFASVTCLMGNHDRMMLDFLDDPAAAGPRWLAHGGAETLASFRVPAPAPGDAGARLQAQAQGLEAALGDLRGWIAGWPLSWSEGRLWVTHAGADPCTSPAGQDPQGFLWGGRGFYEGARRDDLWVAHGHRIVEAPCAQGGRIAVDTGAWRTGRLTAAVLVGGVLRFEGT